MQPNLFSLATKELSQDAFITWLLQWSDSSHQSANSALHQAAVDFTSTLIALQDSTPTQTSKVKAGRQRNDIDVWAEVNDSHLIIIEDKTGTKHHSNQLARYKATGQQWCDKRDAKLICVYLKTHSESLASLQTVIDEGYAVFNRRNFLDLLNRHQVDNDIYNDFQFHLQQLDDTETQYHHKAVEAWDASDWKGFYQALEADGIVESWDYVPNQTGGFWNAIIGGSTFEGRPCYMQIEQGDLCFKIGEVYKERRNIRNRVHHLLTSQSSSTLPISKPRRFGSGNYMTVAIVPHTEWIQTSNGKLDVASTAAHLRSYKNWLIETLASAEQPLVG